MSPQPAPRPGVSSAGGPAKGAGKPPPPVPWRRARNADKPMIERLLTAQYASSMFPLADLRDHGLDGLAPRGLHVWFSPDDSGLVALSNNGVLMPQLPRLRPADGAGLRLALDGKTIRQIIGPDAQLRNLIKALALDEAPVRSAARQPGFTLSLADLKLPEAEDLDLRATHVSDRPLLTRWRAAYLVEVRNLAPGKAAQIAAEEVDGFLAGRNHRILMQGARAVAMTGFTAVHGTVAQVGGVFTPVELRKRGFARAAVALHLAEMRDRGLRTAVLYAASDPAARAYRALGFRPSHTMGLISFAADQTVTAPPAPPPEAER